MANHQRPPAGEDHGGQAETHADGGAGAQDDSEIGPGPVKAGRITGGPDWAIANANTAFRKKLAAVIAATASTSGITTGPCSTYAGTCPCSTWTFRSSMAAQIHMAGSTWIRVSRQLENSSFSPVEEHQEGADGKSEWGEQPPRAAQPQQLLLHGRVITFQDRADEPLRPGCRPGCRAWHWPVARAAPGRRGVAGSTVISGRRSRLLVCIPFDRHCVMPLRKHSCDGQIGVRLAGTSRHVPSGRTFACPCLLSLTLIIRSSGARPREISVRRW